MSVISSLSWNLVVALLTISTGYWVALRPKQFLTPLRMSLFMSVGTGILLTTVFMELLPHSLKLSDHSYGSVFAIVLSGVLIVFAFEKYLAPHLNFFMKKHEDDGCAHHHEYSHDHGHNHSSVTGPVPDHSHATCGHAIIGHAAACSAVGCLIICSFFDGIAFSASGFGDADMNKVILVGQLFHVIPEGMLAAGLIMASEGERRSAKIAALLTGLFFLVGALIPMFSISLFASLEIAEMFFLAFASGILLYVTLVQLLPVVNQARLSRVLFISSIVLTVVVFKLLGHHH